MPKHILEYKTKQEIEEAVNKANCLFDALILLGYHYAKPHFANSKARNYFRKICCELNIDITKFDCKNHKKGKRCAVCGKKILYSNITGYCKSCLTNERINKWLETGKLNVKPTSAFPLALRSYILKEQNGKCAICGLSNFWNGKKLNFVLDHIDGDASNNSRNNVRLVCPNCDSQLDTFKSKNKNSARNFRHKYYLAE